jgi:hypothetical protein
MAEEPVSPLVLEVVAVVHPVDVDVHPSCPPGYRWAVQVGGRPPADLDYCVQAGHEAAQQDALVMAEMVGVACVQAFRKLGSPAKYGVLRLDYDPLPASADDRPIVEFK